jgi:hypothetical protein
MRAIDDDTPIKVAVLRALRRWRALPESDLTRMLRPYFLVTDDYRDMSEEGLLDMEFIGDEYILSLTTLGKLYLEQHDQDRDDQDRDNQTP